MMLTLFVSQLQVVWFVKFRLNGHGKASQRETLQLLQTSEERDFFWSSSVTLNHAFIQLRTNGAMAPM